MSSHPTEQDNADAVTWLKANDLDYEKYGDRRSDRSAYDTLMNYEISPILEEAFLAGLTKAREQIPALVEAERLKGQNDVIKLMHIIANEYEESEDTDINAIGMRWHEYASRLVKLLNPSPKEPKKYPSHKASCNIRGCDGNCY